MALISALLRDLDPTGKVSSLEQQFQLASLITSASARGTRPGAPEQFLTPLVVRLFVERSVKLQAEGRALEALPSSVPEAYFDFLRGVNPRDSSKPNFFSDEDMLRAARVLAVACLGESYVPGEIDSELARRVLMDAGWYGADKRDPIERLKSNGILVQRSLGSRYRLSFALDPVAEYLVADELVEKNFDSAAQLKALLKEVKRRRAAAGFLSALNITIRARQTE